MVSLTNRPVGIVGAGRVGTTMALALAAAGYQVVGVTARSAAARDRAERVLPAVPVLDAQEVAARSSILVLSVADGAIERVAAELAARGAIRDGTYVLHLSGALGLAALDAAAGAGAVPLAVHPAMTFPGYGTDLVNLAGLAWGITARPADRPVAEQFVRDLGGVPVWVPDRNRTLYHAALVLAANPIVSLVAAAMEALALAGADDPALLVGPLARAAVDNAVRHGDDALTGPVRRGDLGTVAAHVRVLRERSPDLAATYLHFAAATAARARRAGLDDAAAVERVGRLVDDQLARLPAPADPP